jgi:hypothetical protein
MSRGVASLRRYEGTCDEALNLFRTAIRLDPNFAAAYGMAAFCYWARKAWSRIADYEREVAEVEWLVRQVEEVGRDDAVALTGAGSVLAYVVGDAEGGAALLDRALALNPSASATPAMVRATPIGTGVNPMPSQLRRRLATAQKAKAGQAASGARL